MSRPPPPGKGVATTKPRYKFVASTRHWDVETFRKWSSEKQARVVEILGHDGPIHIYEHTSPVFEIPCVTVLSPTHLMLLQVIK